MTESKTGMGCRDRGPAEEHDGPQSWRIFGIMSEFVEATERLAAIWLAVTFVRQRPRAALTLRYYA